MPGRRQLRKSIEIPLFDDTVSVDIDMRALEIVERVYDCNADLVASYELSTPSRIMRHKVADVILQWLEGKRFDGRKRTEIREEIMFAEPELFNRYVGAIQAAVLYSLKYITEEQMDTLLAGKDLDLEEPEDPKAPAPETPRPSPTAPTE